MNDYVVRGTALDGKIRVFGALSTGLVEELRKRQGTYPVVTAALGRTATMAAIMGIMLKGEEKVSIQINGGGPVGRILADANAYGEVRGYVTHPDVLGGSNDNGKLDVKGVVGTDGYVTVIKDLGMREPYQGQVEIISGELGEDFAYYFTQSEQTPSAVGVGVLLNKEDASVRVAGGFLLQLLPGLRDEEITEIEEQLAKLGTVTAILQQGITPEQIVERLIPGPIHFMERTPLTFRCTCDRSRLENVLISLGSQELESMKMEQGQAEVTCSFCRDTHLFSEEDLDNLIQMARAKHRE